MISLSSSISFEVDLSESISPKTLHLLRSRLQVALDEAAHTVMDELGVVSQGGRVIHVEEIEVMEVETE